MNNYYYLVASLPDLSGNRNIGDRTAESIIGEIRERVSSGDAALVEFLEKGYEEENLTEDFYRSALSHKNGFLREWFRFDLNVKNTKVAYLNAALGRKPLQDVMPVDGGTFEEAAELDRILKQGDILSRERGIDDIAWKKVDELTVFHYFDMTVILGFIVKLKIIDRWMKLDEATGREMFRRLVDEVRGTFKGFGPADTKQETNDKRIKA